jgi:predicted negative regulator of RcsB-dependent stress response
VARLTRHDLKEHEFEDTIESFQEFVRQYAQQIIIGVAAVIVVAGAIVGWRSYNENQAAAANAALSEALKTFQAPVSAAPVNLFSSNPAQPTNGQFTSDQEKYKAALSQFSAVATKYPRQKAADFARYYVGLCQSAMGDDAAAQKTLTAVGHSSDKDAAALASLALAGDLAKTGKTAEAAEVYNGLAQHPTATVPRTTALLAEADLYRNTQPAQARTLYEQAAKEVGSDSYLASSIQQQIASLPK